MRIPFLLPLLLAITLQPCNTTKNPSLIPFSFHGRGTVASVQQLADRIFNQDVSKFFSFALIDDCPPPHNGTRAQCFVVSYDEDNDLVKVQGTSASELSYGLGFYLRKFLGHSFAWQRAGGHRVELPVAWPYPPSDIVQVRQVPMSYFNNVVTFSYSFVWHSFKDWEFWIDWAALNGVNVAIAYTGQEEVYRRTFNKFGVSDEEFAQWCNGPAYLAWSRGQNLHGLAAPLPLTWMRAQFDLQKQILARMRELGMVPVLPAFQGNVPPKIRQLHPHANITKTGTPWVDAFDPLFMDIQKTYLEILVDAFGTDHWYETDGYFDQHQGPWFAERRATDTAVPPPLEDVPVDTVAEKRSRQVYNSLAQVDPDAIWLYQGWIWRGWGSDKLSYMKGWVSGVPTGRFVMLDMYDEVMPMWDKFDYFSYYQTPFIWSVLHNFGGNLGMWGSLDRLNSEPFRAYKHPNASIVGVGAAPEGIDQNPVYYQLLLDVAWMDAPVDVSQYAYKYGYNRYGLETAESRKLMVAAWDNLLASVYAHNTNEFRMRKKDFRGSKPCDGLTSMPFSNLNATPLDEAWFDVRLVAKAWGSMVELGKLLHEGLPETFAYDLVNVGREVMAQRSNVLFHKLVQATTPEETRQVGDALLELQVDVDKLLCTSPSFSAKPWIERARAWGDKLSHTSGEVKGNSEETPREVDGNNRPTGKLVNYLVLNARAQVTTWGPQAQDKPMASVNRDYAAKQWGGLLDGFYNHRLACYIDQKEKDLKAGRKTVDKAAVFACAGRVSYAFTNDVGASTFAFCKSAAADASALRVSEAMFGKYAAGVSQKLAEEE